MRWLKRNLFYLEKDKSPTYYNLSVYLQEIGWQSSAWRSFSKFNSDNLAFDEGAAQCLEYKHLLAYLVQQYCPEVMPLTYCINDHNWQFILNQLAHKFYLKDHKLCDEVANLIWILKPALLNNGQAIKLFKKLSDLEQHFLSMQRLGGEHVLQQYIINPHLLRDQRKYSIRQFLIITNYNGAYLYHDGYFNVALQPFSLTNLDIRAHLTNEHLSNHESNVIQIPSNQFSFFPHLQPAIVKIAIKVLTGLQKCYPTAFTVVKKPAFALFGIDFMVDEHHKVWLLEVNHGPCFPTTANHPLKPYLYQPFWQAIVNHFVLPISNRQLTHLVDTDLFTRLTN